MIVSWLFFHFSYNTYQNAVFAIEERDQLLQEKKELIANKEKLTLLRSYLNSDSFVYEEALKFGYSFEDETVIDVDYLKIEKSVLNLIKKISGLKKIVTFQLELREKDQILMG